MDQRDADAAEASPRRAASLHIYSAGWSQISVGRSEAIAAV